MAENEAITPETTDEDGGEILHHVLLWRGARLDAWRHGEQMGFRLISLDRSVLHDDRVTLFQMRELGTWLITQSVTAEEQARARRARRVSEPRHGQDVVLWQDEELWERYEQMLVNCGHDRRQAMLMVSERHDPGEDVRNARLEDFRCWLKNVALGRVTP